MWCCFASLCGDLPWKDQEPVFHISSHLRSVTSACDVAPKNSIYPLFFLIPVFLITNNTAYYLKGQKHLPETRGFSFQVEVLSDPKIWLTASTQIFFSLSVAFGGMIAFSSYNPKDSDVELDTFIVSITNSATSILATVVIFAVLGFKATVDYENCVNRWENRKLQMGFLLLLYGAERNLPNSFEQNVNL